MLVTCLPDRLSIARNVYEETAAVSVASGQKQGKGGRRGGKGGGGSGDGDGDGGGGGGGGGDGDGGTSLSSGGCTGGGLGPSVPKSGGARAVAWYT
ncbi:unnamed protein product [Closterium sp. NIES-54]